MFCEQCGLKLGASARFCGACGTATTPMTTAVPPFAAEPIRTDVTAPDAFVPETAAEPADLPGVGAGSTSLGGWCLVAALGGLAAFVMLKVFRLAFDSPSNPTGGGSEIVKTAAFVLYGRDIFQWGLLGAVLALPFALYWRPSRVPDQTRRFWGGIALGVAAGLIGVVALGFLFSANAIEQYAKWFVDPATFDVEQIRWVLRVPWIGAWAVFGLSLVGLLSTWLGVRSQARAYIGGMVLCGVAAAVSLEIGFHNTNIDSDVWTAIHCVLFAVAAGMALAFAGAGMPEEVADEI